jgi:hypothetical protein
MKLSKSERTTRTDECATCDVYDVSAVGQQGVQAANHIVAEKTNVCEVEWAVTGMFRMAGRLRTKGRA